MQTTGGQTYSSLDYSYDLSGALVSQTYPSGRVVRNETDNIGRLSKVTSQKLNDFERTHLNHLAYTSFGAVLQAKLGNGRWENTQYDNKRLQIKQIRLGASAGDTTFLKLEYGYGTTDNNGSLREQKITVQGMSSQIVQSYTYDALNRLKSATETPVGSSQSWKQTFDYDRFGNRRFDAANTTTLPANNNVYNPNIDKATNQFTLAEGYDYDDEGNLLSNPENQLFQYDAENRQTQVQNTATQTTANYFYDGSGKRVKKVIGNQETVFVYDAFGKLVAEYVLNQTITTNGTQYLTVDALGSPRAITNVTGQVASRHDYLPFGEEISSNIGGRTPAQGYGADDKVRQQFTGYERDTESGLDYAQARYFASKHGRFTSVDPLTASANIKSPQTFNRYSYGLNSPYKFTDSLGLQSQCQGPGGGSNVTTLASCDGAQSNECPPLCDDDTIVIDVPYDPAKSDPNCGEKTTEECSMYAGQTTTVGFVAPVSPTTVTSPTTAPVTNPGVGRVILTTIGRTIIAPVLATAATITLLPQTVQAPTSPQQQTTTTTTTDRDNRSPVYVRLGSGIQSLEDLRKQAEAAQAAGFPYGISVLLFTNPPTRTDIRTASVPVANSVFEIIKTGTSPNHYTLVFPKPLTQGTVDLFYNIFTPR